MDDSVKLSPRSLLSDIYLLAMDKNNFLRREELARKTVINKEIEIKDCAIASSLAMALEALHGKIWPNDKCKIIFFHDRDGREHPQIGTLWDSMYQRVEYKIYVPGIAKKIDRIKKTDLMYFNPLKGANQIIGKDDWRNPDEATAILMAVAGILRECYRDENWKDSMADFSLCFGKYENLQKINDPRFKIVADHILKIERDFGNEEFNFDTTLIVYWIGCLCQNPLGIAIGDLVKAITLKPEDVGIT
jgi:hypothetical protein